MSSIAAQVRTLQKMSLPELQQKWREVFGEDTQQRDRAAMWRRLAVRLQEDLLGSLSSEDRATVERYRDEFRRTPPDQWFPGANHNQARRKAPRTPRDRRVPPPGSTITRQYLDQEIAVRVLDKGFEYQGRSYRSLSAVAREVTGTGWNGFVFFGLTREAGR